MRSKRMDPNDAPDASNGTFAGWFVGDDPPEIYVPVPRQGIDLDLDQARVRLHFPEGSEYAAKALPDCSTASGRYEAGDLLTICLSAGGLVTRGLERVTIELAGFRVEATRRPNLTVAEQLAAAELERVEVEDTTARLEPGEAYRRGAAAAVEAWSAVHVALPWDFHPRVTLPYPSTWPAQPDTVWTRYAYAVARPQASSVDETICGTELQSMPWATVTHRGLEGEPALEATSGPLQLAGPRLIGPDDETLPAPPLGPLLVRSTRAALPPEDAELLAGMVLFAQTTLVPPLRAAIEQRHAGFFRWLRAQPPRTPLRHVCIEDIFALPAMGASDDVALEIARRRAREHVAGTDRVDLRRRDDAQGDGGQLPLRILVLDEFSSEAPRGPLSPVVCVQSNDLSAAMRALSPSVEIEVPNRVEQGAPRIHVNLAFHCIEDFDAQAVAERIPALRRLLELRAALTAMRGPLGGEKRFQAKIESVVRDSARRNQLALECGALADGSSAALAAREEDQVARDEAYATRDPARVAELVRHRCLFVRRAACESLALKADGIARVGPPIELLEQAASNPALVELASTGQLLASLRSGNPLTMMLALRARWTEEVRRWTATDSREQLLIHIAVEMPLEPAEIGIRAPARALDRFERLWRWTRQAALNSDLYRIGFAQATRSELDALIAGRGSVAEQLRAVAERVPWLWREVASHPDCPESVLQSLASAPQALVRAAVASHPVTPRRIVRALLGDVDPSVSEVAHRRLGVRFAALPIAYVQPRSAYHNHDPDWNRPIFAAIQALAESPLPARSPDVGAGESDNGEWVERLLAYRSIQMRGEGPFALDCSETELAKAAQGTGWSALGAATHPRASHRVLRALAAHAAPFIRLVVRHRT